MNSQNKKSLQIVLLVLVAVLTLGIGYASITAVNLIISGNATASVNDNNFKVYFVPTGDTPSLTGNVTVSGNARINTQDNTKAEFDVSGLTKIGDYAIATYTILNNSNSIGADISLYLTNSNPEYFRVTETVTDTILQAGDTTTGSIKVELIKTPLNDDVSTSVTGTLKADAIENESATGLVPKSKASDDPESFATDSWATIKKAVQDNNTSVYNVGDTKTVEINGNNYTVRIANKSIPAVCNSENYSQTACGFVVEFVDILDMRSMNTEVTNVGGWPACEAYDYVNDTLYSSLPEDLKSAIILTKAISSHGPNEGEENFVSMDKLYLLTSKEVVGEKSWYSDTARDLTRQLDYYNMVGVNGMTYVFGGIRKDYEGTEERWWLRDADINFQGVFYLASRNTGGLSNYHSDYVFGISPAFRIG